MINIRESEYRGRNRSSLRYDRAREIRREYLCEIVDDYVERIIASNKDIEPYIRDWIMRHLSEHRRSPDPICKNCSKTYLEILSDLERVSQENVVCSTGSEVTALMKRQKYISRRSLHPERFIVDSVIILSCADRVGSVRYSDALNVAGRLRKAFYEAGTTGLLVMDSASAIAPLHQLVRAGYISLTLRGKQIVPDIIPSKAMWFPIALVEGEFEIQERGKKKLKELRNRLECYTTGRQILARLERRIAKFFER